MVSCEKVINLKLGDGESPVYSGYVDLAQCLCKLNRKGAFRQGMQYAIESIRIQSYGVTGNKEVQIHRLPDNWVTTNSWVKALAQWNEQELETADDTGNESIIAKWRDFKVYMTADHADEGVAKNLLPDGYSLTDVAPSSGYNWSPSQIVIPNTGGVPGATTETYLHMLGDDNGGTSKSIILAYAKSRARPMAPDPNVMQSSGGGLWAEMEDMGGGQYEEKVIENVSTENNVPPYPINTDSNNENYPGGKYVGTNIKGHTEAIVPIGDGFRSVVPGFVAPLGLLKISTTHDSGITKIQIRLAGSPKGNGVLAQSMKVAN